MAYESELRIGGIGFPLFSCREAEQILYPIKQGEMRRTVNGDLCYVGLDSHHKYKSKIICSDKEFPAMQQLWAGSEVMVSCIAKLWERVTADKTGVQSYQITRPCVKGSIVVKDNDNNNIDFKVTSDNRTIELSKVKKGQEIFVGYNPALKMRIENFLLKEEEWEGDRSWSLELEEV